MSKQEPDYAKSYWNTYHCQNKITSSGGRLYGDYCKNRYCNVCCAIRTAEIINKYLPVMKTWPDPHFVTLTSKAVPVDWLKGRVFNMLRALKIITDRHRKRAIRGTGTKLIGIKSLECNFNPKAKTYNVHFHIIVATKEMGNVLVKDWLDLWKNKFAVHWAQKSKRVWDNERALKEIVKYSTKTFTDPTMTKRTNGKAPVKNKTHILYIAAFHNIISAMKGHRVFDRFGFNLPKTPRRPPGGTQTKLTDYTELIFDPKQFDWTDPETDQFLSGYELPPELMELLINNTDRDLE